jgi:DDE superfamily endonuclease
MNSLQDSPARVEALCGLSRFRAGLHACFTRRGDALFELADAMLCAQGPVRSPVELSLEPEFRRRHGSVYDALAQGRISSGRLRHLLAGLTAPGRAGEPLMFAIDTTPLARPDAQYAGERTMVQVRGKGGDRWLPGWPCSLLVGIGWGSSSWARSHRGAPAAARRGAHRRHDRPDHRAAHRPGRDREAAARRPAAAGPARCRQLRHRPHPRPGRP